MTTSNITGVSLKIDSCHKSLTVTTCKHSSVSIFNHKINGATCINIDLEWMHKVSMMELKREQISSRMDISHQVGVPFIGKTTSRLVKKIKFHHSIENSNTLPDLLKLKRPLVFLDQMVSNQMVSFKENSVIAGSWQQLPQLLSKKKELKKSSLIKNTTQTVFSCSTCSTWVSQSKSWLTISFQLKKMVLKSNKNLKPTAHQIQALQSLQSITAHNHRNLNHWLLQTKPNLTI